MYIYIYSLILEHCFLNGVVRYMIMSGNKNKEVARRWSKKWENPCMGGKGWRYYVIFISVELKKLLFHKHILLLTEHMNHILYESMQIYYWNLLSLKSSIFSIYYLLTFYSISYDCVGTMFTCFEYIDFSFKSSLMRIKTYGVVIFSFCYLSWFKSIDL